MAKRKSADISNPITHGMSVGWSAADVKALKAMAEVYDTKQGVLVRQTMRKRLMAEGFLEPPQVLKDMMTAMGER